MSAQRATYRTVHRLVSPLCTTLQALKGVFGTVGYTGIRFFFGGCTELSELLGTGMEYVPKHAGVFGRVLRAC